MGNFSPVTGMKFATIIALTIIALSTNLTNKANSNTFEVEMHTRQNYAILASRFRKQSYFVKKFRPGNGAEVFIWGSFHPGCRDLGNRDGPPSHIASYQHIAIITKEIGVRRDLGKKAARSTGLI